jgi:hypothetical protein
MTIEDLYLPVEGDVYEREWDDNKMEGTETIT